MPGRNSKTNTFTGGMVKDLHESAVSDKTLTHARNAMMRSKDGDAPYYVNEPATLECINLPYKFNGYVQLKDDRLLVFSSDNTNNEIGIANTLDCSYTKKANATCLNFNNDFPITGIVREDEDGNEEVIFNDSINPTRILRLDDIPYTYTEANDDCKTKTYTNELSCPDLRFFSKLQPPCISLSKGSSGTLKDGSYQIAIAYLIDDIKYSDYYSLTTPVHINNEFGQSSILIEIENLDTTFDDYQVVVIGCIEGASVPKIVGSYSTSQNKITISDFDNPEYLVISNEQLVITKVNYEKAGIISSNAQYALLGDLTAKKRFNVQEFSSQVELEYRVKRCPLSYYNDDGKDYSYWRDENYSFYLNYVYCDGEPSQRGHIVGPKAKPADLKTISGCDKYEENTLTDCNQPEPVYRWQAYNTASDMVTIKNEFDDSCCIEVGYGSLGFYQSTELYPDDKDIYGDLACTPIRMHKFPDECKVPRYVTDNGKRYIQILGVKAKNIPYPKDSDGNPIEGITGYEIIRADRDGNNKTVLAAGLMSNVRSYNDPDEGEILYNNAPYNDLSADSFLSSTQTQSKNGEKNLNRLTTINQDKFNFYTPHGEFFEKYRMGEEFKFHTEEIGDVQGYFETVYKHPRHKLITNTTFYFAAILGIVEAYLTTNGKKCVTKELRDKFIVGGTPPTGLPPVVVPNPDIALFGLYKTGAEDCDTAYKLAGGSTAGGTLDPNPITNPTGFIRDGLTIAERLIASFLQTAAKITSFLTISAEYANNTLEVIRNFSKPRDYVYQYNSKSIFNNYKCIAEGNKRRGAVTQPLYLTPHLQTVNNKIYNNYQAQKSIYVETNCEVNTPSTVDNTRQTIKEFGTCSNPSKRVGSTASMYYVTSKQKNPNQYGAIDNFKTVKVSSCVQPITEDGVAESPVFFGGDAVIFNHTVNTKQALFTQNLGDADFPDETGFDYRLYRNIAYPRYWADFTEYDMGDIMNIFGSTPSVNSVSLAALPANKFNLDCNNNSSPFIVNDEFMYTRLNGVLDFIVEADYNIAFRRTFQEGDGEIHQPHYSERQTNLSYIFREDRVKKPEGFYLKPCYKNITSPQIIRPQVEDLDKLQRQRNAVIYSLPQFNTQSFNNWRYFLPANYYNFDIGEYGYLTGIHPTDDDRLLFLFTKSSPYISLGRDELKTENGVKVTIGDGGLFARQPRELMHTDVAYGSSHDPYAIVSTQFGHFYPSSKQGKLFNFRGNSIDEISRQGMHHWSADYAKILLKKDFPNYTKPNNILTGVGYSVVFDSEFETVYYCKRDYCIKDKYKGQVTYNATTETFDYKDQTIQLGDSKYFDDASVTLSYHAGGGKTGNFVSFHDWHPDWTIQQENHFITAKGNSLYKHNERFDLYCNFYGVDYPHELEIVGSQGINHHMLTAVEYIQDVEIHEDRNPAEYSLGKQLKYPTFDEAIVHNKYQNSGILSLVYDANKRGLHNKYPKRISSIKREIPYSKEIEYYRFNMFDDKTKNLESTTHQWDLACNGYIKNLNPDYLDLKKKSRNTANFNHTYHSVFLRRNISGNQRLITRHVNLKIILPTHQ